MSRPAISYNAPSERANGWAGHEIDVPVPGYYRMRLRSGGVMVGVRIWFGAPLDPATLDELDRAPCWNALINGAWANLDQAWPRCAGEPIDEAEYLHLGRQQAWAAQALPGSALADPTKRIDPLSSPMLF